METFSFSLNFWPGLSVCNSNVYSQKVCNGFSKFYHFIFDNRMDTVGTFDLLLLYSFVVIFLAFLVAAVFALFENEQKSLQQIKNKVKLSTATMANIAAAFWAIRETKFKSITYEGYCRIGRCKNSMLELQDLPKPAEALPVEPEPDEEIPTPRKSRITKSPRSSPLLKKALLSSAESKGKLPQPKFTSGLGHLGVPVGKKKNLRTIASSNSLRPNKFGLAARKSQHSIFSSASSKSTRKSVHIVDPPSQNI